MEIFLAIVGIAFALWLVGKCEEQARNDYNEGHEEYLQEMRRRHGDACYYRMREQDREFEKSRRYGKRRR